jgi:D-3-phosphoglycerate dehydrogenase / 2-oxoglutarate reductase
MKILIASSIDSEAIKQLQEKHDVICAFNADEAKLKALIVDREVLIFRSGVQINAAVMGQAPQLKFLVRAGSGLDNLDVEYAQSHEIKLVRVPQPGAKAVAELAFAMMLSLSRQMIRADVLLRKGRWIKSELTGFLLTGKTLGIIGMGNIGSRVGHLGKAWGMDVLGCVEHPSPERAAAFLEKGLRLTSCEEVLETADYVSIHVPLKDSTRNLIKSPELARMKPGAYLTTLARGGVVDEQALYHELTAKGRLAGAGLDVHLQEGEGKISPLAKLENVILTPHIGAMTIDSQREIGSRVINLMESFAKENEL